MAETTVNPLFSLDDLLAAQGEAIEKEDAATGRSISLRNVGGLMFGAESTMEVSGRGIASSIFVTCMSEDTNIVARALLDAVFDESLRFDGP